MTETCAELDVLIESATSPGEYVVATAANRGVRRSTAIALDAWAGATSGSVGIQCVGPLDASSILGPGAATWVRTSTLGKIERVAAPADGDDIIGRCDALGRVTLHFEILTAGIINGGGGGSSGKTTKAMANANQTLTAEEAEKATWRATGTLTARRKLIVTPPATEAESYQRAIVNDCTGAPILVSVGTGDEAQVDPYDRAIVDVTPTGTRVVARSNQPLEFNVLDFGAKGDATLGSIGTGTDDTAAFLAAIEAAGAVGSYTGAVVYVPGNRAYRFASNLDVSRLVTISGQIGAYEWNPAVLQFDALKGIVFHGFLGQPDVRTFGSIIRRLRIISAVSAINVWQASTAYTIGDKVRAPNDNRSYFEALNSGTSGGSAPDWSHKPDPGGGTGDKTTDGTITWQTRKHCGVLCLDRVRVEDCQVGQFTNAGVSHIGETGRGTFANGNSTTSCRIVGCGVGIEIDGGDGNVGMAYCCDVESSGNGQSGTGGFGISDRSFLGCTFVSCQFAGTTGSWLYRPTSFQPMSTAVGCYAEADCGPADFHGLFLGGDNGAGFASNSWYGYSANQSGWHKLWPRPMGSVGVNIRYDQDENDTWFAHYSNDDGGGALLGERYNASSDPVGSYVWGLRGSTVTRRTYALTHSKAKEGNGHFWLFNGELRGNDITDPYYLGVDSSSKTDPYTRAGLYGFPIIKQGDRFEPKATGSAMPVGDICTTTGYPSSATWAASSSFVAFVPDSASAPPGSFVSPTVANGFTYVPGKSGTTSGSEPTWPTTFLGSGGIVPLTWVASNRRRAGDYGRPTTPNGHYYKVTAVSSPDHNGYGTLGSGEPTWPTGGGSTVADGAITWTEQGSDTGTYVADGGVVWQCVGPVPVYESYGLPVTAALDRTPQTSSEWADTAFTSPAAAKSKVRSGRVTASTTEVTANQVLATISLNDNTTNILSVTIKGKLPSSTSGVTAKLEGSFTRNGGTVTRLGTDDASTVKSTGSLAGSTFDLNISSTSIQVRTTPATADDVDWSVVHQLDEVKN